MSDVQIFFPVDVPTLRKGYSLMEEVGPYIDVPKVGLEFLHSVGTPAAVSMIKEFGKLPFVDAKLNDIPNTVKGATEAIAKLGVAYFNVMASGGRPMMEAAMEGAIKAEKETLITRPKIIAVTVLTSLKLNHMVEIGIAPSFILDMSLKHQEKYIDGITEDEKQSVITEIVMRWATAAVKAGVDCLLSSPLEIASMHNRWPDKELICPGIRMPDSPPDDQGRTATPGEAARFGATAIVVGRPIRIPPEGKTRTQVVQEIRTDIEKALAT